MRERALPLGLAALAAIVMLTAVEATRAAFRATTTSTASFGAAADWVAPSASAIIVKSSGGGGGAIRSTASYHVYANLTESGNPPSGVSSVTANVGSVTAGQTAVTLTSGSYSVLGVSYSHRSAALTSDALADGSYGYTVSSTDRAGNARTQSFSVAIDTRAPTNIDVQASNGGATPGRLEAGDQLSLVYDEQMDPPSILAGWTGASTNVVVRVADHGGSDKLTIWNAGNASQLPFGTIDLARKDYVTADVTFGATGTASTMTRSGSSILIRLGTPSSTTAITTAAAAGTLSWSASNGPTDHAGNACSCQGGSGNVSESGASDVDF